jgi:HTH-type transcriptional regulator / antitoxin HipB
VSKTYPVSTSTQLSTVLRAMRKSKGLTQEKLGHLMGVSQKRMAAIEAKPERTSFDQISQLVSALGGRLTIEVPGHVEEEKFPSMLREDSGINW